MDTDPRRLGRFEGRRRDLLYTDRKERLLQMHRGSHGQLLLPAVSTRSGPPAKSTMEGVLVERVWPFVPGTLDIGNGMAAMLGPANAAVLRDVLIGCRGTLAHRVLGSEVRTLGTPAVLRDRRLGAFERGKQLGRERGRSTDRSP